MAKKEEQKKLYVESMDDGCPLNAYSDPIQMGHDFALDQDNELEVDVFVFSHKAIIKKRVTVEAVK